MGTTLFKPGFNDPAPSLTGRRKWASRHGLRRLPQTLNHGLRALMEVSGMNGHATSADVGLTPLAKPACWRMSHIGERCPNQGAGRIDQAVVLMDR